MFNSRRQQIRDTLVLSTCLAQMLYEGEGGPVDMKEARVHFKKAADQGDSACSVLHLAICSARARVDL